MTGNLAFGHKHVTADEGGVPSAKDRPSGPGFSGGDVGIAQLPNELPEFYEARDP